MSCLILVTRFQLVVFYQCKIKNYVKYLRAFSNAILKNIPDVESLCGDPLFYPTFVSYGLHILISSSSTIVLILVFELILLYYHIES